MRIFKKDMLDPSAMKDFIDAITGINYSILHDNILRLEDLVKGPDGQIALVHPFYPKTIELMMRLKRKPSLTQRIQIITRIIAALAHAHNYRGADGKFRRTFHLHLQPSHILIDEDFTSPAIASMGFSQTYRNLTRGKQSRWQDPGTNPATIPPEFFKSRSTVIRERSADIYSLGIVMYYMVTGDYPFEGPKLDDYKFQHTKIFAAPPRLIDPSVPDWIEPIILGCLEKEPDKRWDTVNEIAQAFERNVK